MHLTLGILRQSQAVFYALAFFQSDGFAVPAPAQVTQTVSVPLRVKPLGLFQKYVLVKSSLSLQNQVSGFSKSFGLFKSGLLAVVISKNCWLQNWLMFFVPKVSRQIGSGFQNRLHGFLSKLWQASSFILRSHLFVAKVIFCKIRSLKLASWFAAKVLASSVWAFLSGSFSLAK